MAEIDEVFKNCGQSPGLELFRVENKKIVKQPKCDGKFHKGDSYLLLATIQDGTRLKWNLHFWLGSESSQDEYGIAAYKTVELDEALGGSPVQFREVEGHESSQFMSYFKNSNVQYLPGGVASGFTKVVRDEYRPRLLQIKGKRVARIKELPIKYSSLNVGDVFILDLGLKLFLFFGEKASMAEKTKGVETITSIKDNDRGGKADVIFVHEDPKNKEFWDTFGGFRKITAEGEKDELSEKAAASSLKLLEVDSKGNTKPVSTEKIGLSRELLMHDKVYILDSKQEIFVWIGNKASYELKKEAMMSAAKYIEGANLPKYTRTTRIVEGTETATFKGLFKDWLVYKPPQFGLTASETSEPRNSLSTEQIVHRALSGKEGNNEGEEIPSFDENTGELKIWRIENFERVDWPKERYGHFYRGDSFVLLYSYEEKSGRKSHIIYFWQGHDSSTDEVGASALLAKELDEELGGQPVQVRVTQGKEPSHFRKLFHGSMVIHKGGHASGFTDVYDDDKEEEAVGNKHTSCFHVKGTSKGNDTYGVEVDPVASSLNSGDSFVVVTAKKVFLWNGKYCAESEASVAQNIAKCLQSGYKGGDGREIVVLKEDNESEDFWACLGGKGEYSHEKAADQIPFDPRLFQISNSTGEILMEEVFGFDQSDLCNDDVMLLDTFNEIFVWVGEQSNEQEKAEAMAIGKAYVENSTDGRDAGVPVIRVAAGNESGLFTQHFRGWDPDMLKRNAFVDPFEVKMKALKERQEAEEKARGDLEGTITMESLSVSEKKENVVKVRATKGGFVPYEQLKGIGKDGFQVMEGVDNNAKEASLSPEEFREVFGMTSEEFAIMPKWKQIAAKKKADLF